MKNSKGLLSKLLNLFRVHRSEKPVAGYLDLPDAPDFISTEPKLSLEENYLLSKKLFRGDTEEWAKNPPSPEEFKF